MLRFFSFFAFAFSNPVYTKLELRIRFVLYILKIHKRNRIQIANYNIRIPYIRNHIRNRYGR